MTDSHQPWTQWIGLETIATLYVEGIKRYGGKQGEPEKGCIDAALGAAYNAELYTPEADQEDVITGLVFACCLLFYLATKHCYIDGNKRIAWICAMFVLLRFGLTVQATEDEAIAFCTSIADGTVRTRDAVIDWITSRLIAI